MIDLGLSGLSCIVTGGTRGIGRCVVELLLEQGARVTTTGLRPDTTAALRADLSRYADELQVVQQDLSDDDSGRRIVDAATARSGEVHVLVNNAAAFELKPGAAVGTAEWVELFGLKMLGYHRMVEAVVPAMSGHGGAITNVAGTAGVHASPMFPHVGAINAAIVSASESWALSFAPRRIRVNVVSPGLTATDRFLQRSAAQATADGTDVESAARALAGGVPVGHAADPREVALAAVVLSSPGFASVTGAHLVIDGGETLDPRRRT